MGSRERELGRGAAGVEDQSVISDAGAGITAAPVKKKFDSGQKYPPTFSFYGSLSLHLFPSPSTPTGESSVRDTVDPIWVKIFF